MKMTRRNFISASAAAMLACGASLSAHAAENTTENGLNFITDIFKDPTQPGETEGATTITAEANAGFKILPHLCGATCGLRIIMTKLTTIMTA